MSHYEDRLEKDLTHIRASVTGLADQVDGALTGATEALLSGDDGIAYATVLGDHSINRASREVDRLCHAFIARHLPSAGHLRLMSSMIRVNVALERVGDYAVTISREALQLSRPPEGHVANQLRSLADEAQGLLRQSVNAFNEGNAEQARSLMPVTDRVESMMDGVYNELLHGDKQREPREIVANFAVFNMLKRISDQAKNICDQTVFSAAGEIKAAKVFHILFIDESNSVQSLIAAALARKRFPEAAQYVSAGRHPVANVDPGLVQFLGDHGVDADDIEPQDIESVQLHLASYDVIVALQGQARDYFPEIPFHVAALNWDLGALPAKPGEEQAMQKLEEVYRELVGKIDDLMLLLVGKDAV